MIISSHIKSLRIPTKYGFPLQVSHRKVTGPEEYSIVIDKKDENFVHERFVEQKRFDRFKRYLEAFSEWKMPEQPQSYIKAKRHGLL